jgi:hypothetical protein
MKSFATLFLSVLAAASTNAAFQQQQARQRPITTTTSTTQLNGWLDFKPVHGGGSAGNSELDEIWEAQQAILRERQGHSKKDVLKNKYKNPDAVDTSSVFAGKKMEGNRESAPRVVATAPKRAPVKAAAANTTPKKTAAPAFKFPWDK